MTARHPMDCYVTPPCAALAIRSWMENRFADHHGLFATPDVLDPFAGPGFLLMVGAPLLSECHAFDLDDRWLPELRRRVDPMNIRVGRDSLGMDWNVRGARPHILTNNPYGLTVEAIEKARDHAYTHRRYAALLLRVDFWHHRSRAALRPDVKLSLEWRPKFAYRQERRRDASGQMVPTGKLVLGSDMSAYAWGIWTPERTGATREEYVAKPDVPAELEAEHKRLAMMAYVMGHGVPQGA